MKMIAENLITTIWICYESFINIIVNAEATCEMARFFLFLFDLW